MNTEVAFNQVRLLGESFVHSLNEMGKPVPDLSPLFHGLAAYEILKLEGVSKWIDECVRVVMMEVIEETKRRVRA